MYGRVQYYHRDYCIATGTDTPLYVQYSTVQYEEMMIPVPVLMTGITGAGTVPMNQISVPALLKTNSLTKPI